MKPIIRTGILALAVLAWGETTHSAGATPHAKPSHYIVSEDIQSLNEIAIYLYGTTRAARQIAKWNRLKRPYIIYSGMKLVLKEPPTLTPQEGSRQLLAMWRERMGIRNALPPSTPTPTSSALPSAPAPVVVLSNSELQSLVSSEESESVASPTASEAASETLVQSAPQEQAQGQAPAQTQAPVPVSAPAEATKQFAVLSKQAEKSTIEALAVVDDIPTPEGLFKSGEQNFKAGKIEAALVDFRRSRQLDTRPLPPWFFELRCLHMLNRDSEAGETANQFITEHPEVKDFPAVQKYLKGQVAN